MDINTYYKAREEQFSRFYRTRRIFYIDENENVVKAKSTDPSTHDRWMSPQDISRFVRGYFYRNNFVMYVGDFESSPKILEMVTRGLVDKLVSTIRCCGKICVFMGANAIKPWEPETFIEARDV